MAINKVVTNMISFKKLYLPKTYRRNEIAKMSPSQLGSHMAKETMKCVKYNIKE